MGEPVTVVQSKSSRPGYLRFETNRSFTGMGHESYSNGDDIYGDRPADQVAKALFDTGQVDEVHVYAQAVTVKADLAVDPGRLQTILEDIFIYYRPGVEVPTEESFATDA